MKPVCCRLCGSVNLVEAKGQWGPHTVRVSCADCHQFAKWGSSAGPSWKDRAVACLRRFNDDEARKLIAEIHQ